MAETTDWNKRFDNIRLAELDYTEKNTNDILDSIEFKDEDERLLCKDIIVHLETSAAEEINNDKCVQLPFIGSIRKNPLKKVLEDNRAKFREISRTNTKEEAKVKYAKVFSDKKEELRKKDYRKAKLLEIRNRYKTKYEQYFTHIGPEYAQLFIATKLSYTPVEFDQELEDKLQELYNE